MLTFVRLASRDDPDHRFSFPVAVAHDQNSELKTHPQQDEPVFLLRMVGIEIDHRILVVERRLRLLEGDSVLPSIGQILAGVPDEPKLIYAYSVRTAARPVKGSFGRRAIAYRAPKNPTPAGSA